MFRAYFEALAGHRRRAAVCVALLMISGLAEVLGIGALLPLLSSNLSGSAGGRTEWFGLSGEALTIAAIGAFVGFGLGAALVRYLADSRIHGLFAEVEESLRSRMVTALLATRWTEYLQITLGDAVKAANKDGERVALGVMSLVLGLGAGAIALVFVVVAAVIEPLMTAAVLVFGVGIAVVYRRVGRRSHALGSELSVQEGLIVETTTDVLVNAKFYRSTGLEQRAVSGIHDQFADWARRFARVQRLRPATKLGADAAGIIVIAGVFAVTLIAGTSSLASVLVFLALFYRLTPRVQDAQQSLLIARTQESWWDAWSAQYDACLEAVEEPSGAVELACPPTIEFDRVRLVYPGRSTPALVDLSCTIEPGQRLAVVGESGAGKTTMLDLVTGLVRPTSGVVRIGGVDVAELQRDAWRQRIGLVMQDTPVFHGTVLENIAFTDAEPDEQQAWWAAEMAHLSDVVHALPDGLHTQLGQKGGTLSGGQRQRLALARALYRKPWLLVLDEATSALDTESERVVQEALSSLRGEWSMLVVAHRLKTVQIADYILVLARGRVVEEGTWSELSSGDGPFRRMLTAQRAEAHV